MVSEETTNPAMAALGYGARGWPVLPLWAVRAEACGCGRRDCPSPGKHPLGPLVPHGLKHATTEPEVIKAWWGQYPKANVGVVTGANLVESEGAPAFLMLTETGPVIATEWQHDGQICVPPPREQIPWLLPRGEEVLRWFAAKEPADRLYHDLLCYFRGVAELPGEGFYDLLTAWTFHSHLLEPVQYSPELCLYAVPERGKTRTGKAAIYVARRGVHVESLRDAYLVRLANNFQATVFFDVMNLWKKAEKAGSEDILLGRFERGIKVPRVLFPDRGPHRDTVFFDIFGPTIIATNVAVHDILDSRGVQINMPQTARSFDGDVTPEAALPLKERLTAWRAHNLGKAMVECPKPAAGRLGDILKPLLQIVRLVAPGREAVFLELVRDIQKSRLADKADSLEAQILLTLDSLRDQISGGALPVKAITDAFNEGRPENGRITYHRMGRKLAALGFPKGKTADGASCIIWDKEKIIKILSAYGLDKIPETPGSSETPGSAGPAGAGDTDLSDDTDVSRCTGMKKTIFLEVCCEAGRRGYETRPHGLQI